MVVSVPVFGSVGGAMCPDPIRRRPSQTSPLGHNAAATRVAHRVAPQAAACYQLVLGTINVATVDWRRNLGAGFSASGVYLDNHSRNPA